jgi:curved DNA-binding protein CbpA
VPRSGQSQTGPKVSAARPPATPVAPAARPTAATPPSSRQAPAAAPGAARPPAAPAERVSAEAMQTGRFLSREEIEAKLARFDELDHYELLELPPDATAEQLSQAFSALARRWHPDRLSPEYGDLRESVTRIFARMSEANRVLGNPNQRKTYDQSLGRNTDSPSEQDQVVQVLRSAEAFQKAEILLKKRDLEGAEALARLAHEGDADQPEYAALYAFIRARRPDAKEEDLAMSLGMLRKAIGKQGDNVKIHYYLACVLKAAGQLGLAIREYRFVADRDPSNVDAARELRLHEMRKGASKPPGAFGKLFKR